MIIQKIFSYLGSFA